MRTETEVALVELLSRLPVRSRDEVGRPVARSPNDWGEGRSRAPVLRLLDRMSRGGEDLAADLVVTTEVVATVMTYRQYGVGRSGWLPSTVDAHSVFEAARVVVDERERLRLRPCPDHEPAMWCARCEPRDSALVDHVRRLRDEWQGGG